VQMKMTGGRVEDEVVQRWVAVEQLQLLQRRQILHGRLGQLNISFAVDVVSRAVALPGDGAAGCAVHELVEFAGYRLVDRQIGEGAGGLNGFVFVLADAPGERQVRRASRLHADEIGGVDPNLGSRHEHDQVADAEGRQVGHVERAGGHRVFEIAADELSLDVGVVDVRFALGERVEQVGVRTHDGPAFEMRRHEEREPTARVDLRRLGTGRDELDFGPLQVDSVKLPSAMKNPTRIKCGGDSLGLEFAQGFALPAVAGEGIGLDFPLVQRKGRELAIDLEGISQGGRAHAGTCRFLDPAPNPFVAFAPDQKNDSRQKDRCENKSPAHDPRDPTGFTPLLPFLSGHRPILRAGERANKPGAHVSKKKAARNDFRAASKPWTWLAGLLAAAAFARRRAGLRLRSHIRSRATAIHLGIAREAVGRVADGGIDAGAGIMHVIRADQALRVIEVTERLLASRVARVGERRGERREGEEITDSNAIHFDFLCCCEV